MRSPDAPTHGPLRVLFVVAQREQSPGSRYRVYQYLPFLASTGLSCRVIAMQGTASTRRSVESPLFNPLRRVAHYAFTWIESLAVQLRVVILAPRFDRVLLYRLPVWVVTRWCLAPLRARIVTDFDDALDTIDHSGEERLGALKRWILRRGLHNAILASTTTITSNAHNSGVVRRLHRRAEVIPTSVDLSRLPFRARSSTAEPTLVIGWIGTPSTAEYLAAIEGALQRVSDSRTVVIRLIGAGRSPFRALAADIRPWSLEDEADALARIDIGLMPMPDTPWTRGKAATKALQYNASGAPAVVSRTATNLAILGEAEGVLFADSLDEWTTALLRLIDDASLRAAMGARGRERVQRSYSLDANAPRLAAVIRDPTGTSSER